jgi:DNA-directed RNA polymerase subunit RPC12/RpoP
MDNWVCMECKHQHGNKRPHRCTKCGSQEVENIG